MGDTGRPAPRLAHGNDGGQREQRGRRKKKNDGGSYEIGAPPQLSIADTANYNQERVRSEVSQRQRDSEAEIEEAAMFFIPGPVIAARPFPGVIIPQAGHLFFPKLFVLQPFDVKSSRSCTRPSH